MIITKHIVFVLVDASEPAYTEIVGVYESREGAERKQDAVRNDDNWTRVYIVEKELED